MGYLLLAVAVFAGATKGYCGKKISNSTQGLRDSIFANILRMFLCIIIGLIIVTVGGNANQLAPSADILLISALSGISTSVFVVSWLISVKKSAYMLLDVFLMTGVLIPIICGSIFFNETVKITQWVGLAILLFSAALMCSYNNSVKVKMTLSGFLLLLLCGVANGFTDLSQKIFVKRMPDIAPSVFNLYTYVFAFITLGIAYLCIKRPQNSETKAKQGFGIYAYITVMAICLFMNSLFKTLAASYLDSALLYPLSQGSALILSTLMSAILFKEKITIKAIVGIVIAFVGLIFINVL